MTCFFSPAHRVSQISRYNAIDLSVSHLPTWACTVTSDDMLTICAGRCSRGLGMEAGTW